MKPSINTSKPLSIDAQRLHVLYNFFLDTSRKNLTSHAFKRAASLNNLVT